MPPLTIAERRKLERQRRIERLYPTKRYQGGAFSDVIDFISTPQAALTGIAEGIGAKEGIRRMRTPSQALGKQGTVGGFAADVLLDPLNFIGGGVITSGGKASLKTGGKLAATLGAQAARGERALVGGVIPFTNIGIPLVPKRVSETVFGGISKASDVVRSQPLVREAFNLIPGTGKLRSTLPEIEEVASKGRTLKQLTSALGGAQRAADAKAAKLAKTFDMELQSLIKRVPDLQASELDDVVKAIDSMAAGKGLAKAIRPELIGTTVRLGKVAQEAGDTWKKVGLDLLEDKGLPLVATEATKDYLQEATKKVPKVGKKLTSATEGEAFNRYTKLRNEATGAEALIEASATGTTAAEIAAKGGRKFVKITPDSYVEIPKRLQAATKQALKSIRSAVGKSTKMDINDMASVLKYLKNKGFRLTKTQEQQLEVLLSNKFTRAAADPVTMNQALEAAGRPLRFETRPGLLVAEKVRRLNRAIARDKWTTALKENIGLPMPKNKSIPEGFTRLDVKGLEDVVFPDPIADVITTVQKAYSDQDAVSAFMKNYDLIHQGVKGILTVVNPAYHFRNMVGNTWQNFTMAGNRNPKNYTDAANILRRLMGLGKALDTESVVKIFDDVELLDNQKAVKIAEKLKAELGAKSLNEMKEEMTMFYDDLLNAHYQELKNSAGKGVEQGGLITDTDGMVRGRIGRQSRNDKWYRDLYKQLGRKPSNKNIKELAKKHLLEGFPDDSGFIQADEQFKKVNTILNGIDKIEEAGLTSKVDDVLKGSELPTVQEEVITQDVATKLEDVLDGEQLKYYKAFEEQGLAGNNWRSVEMADIAADVELEMKSPLTAKVVTGVERASSYAQLVDDLHRLSLFIDRTKKGFSPAEAAMEVKKYFFDYADLGTVEKQVFRRLMSFYAWTRNNLPYQVGALIQEPGKFALLGKMKNFVEDQQEGEPLPDELTPQWMKDGYPIYFGSKDGIARYFNLSGFIPSVDIAQLNDPGQRIVMSGLSPLIKTPIEIMANRSFFFDQPIKDYPGQTEQFLKILNIDPKSVYALKVIRPLAEMNRMLDASQTGTDPTEAIAYFLFGAKFQELDPEKQKAILEYKKALQASSIKRDIRFKAGRGQSTEREQELLQNPPPVSL